MKRLLLPLMGLVALLLLAAPASAANPNCTFTVDGMNFGKGDPARDRNLDMTVTISADCSQDGLDIFSLLMPSIKMCVAISPEPAGSDTGWRHLSGSTGDTLRYNVYTAPDRKTVLKANEKVAVPVVFQWELLTLGRRKGAGTMQIAGRMPPRQSVPDGLYTANVPMTISYFENPFEADKDCNNPSERRAQKTFKAAFLYVSSCQLSISSDIDFGKVLDLDQTLQAQGALRANCDKELPYTIRMGWGNNTESGTANGRFMSNGKEKVKYELFQDSQRMLVWGDGPNDLLKGKKGTGIPISIPIYARVPKQATPPAGTYTDNVVVTLEYN
ncbi:Csu type fimbrial protein [Phyllobacterium endophyticum]|uniref:Csu type fimbrial protein n=1 Tax=Phyllobacterium endophyticum TaxID=1149773 RepID=UPI0011C87DE6|nr:spore coat U domain-containing protein [Phyllobacterium endophyticum]TXR46485.1 spore coat U domain-containing protein [Phyllobacterium endophyticum]